MFSLSKKKFSLYLIEAWGLGVFMVSACLFTALLEYPLSPVHLFIKNSFLRRVVMGLAMGVTATGIISSGWGRKSGAHINPAITLSMFRLKRIGMPDAIGYIIFQILGAWAGVIFSSLLLGNIIRDVHVNYAVTIPGKEGWLPALVGEWIIASIMIIMVLTCSSHVRLQRHIPLFAGILVALFVVFESPWSGFGMNPARTLASAINANVWGSIWIYLLVPPAVMVGITELYIRLNKNHRLQLANHKIIEE
jgi:aquaporin Z